MQSTKDNAGHGRAGALQALLDVAQEPDIVGDYRIASAAFEADDYQQIVALAWRYQFNDDRGKFKREIRELQEHVSQRVLAKLELSE